MFGDIDSVLWCYAFATAVFDRVMTVFFRWVSSSCRAVLSIFIALTSRTPAYMIAFDAQAVAISLFLASRYHWARLLELLPYPVNCGYFACRKWPLDLESIATGERNL